MPEITDEYMKEKLAQVKSFSVIILKKGPAFKMPDVYPVLWEHGRKNFSLKAEGILPVVCPINDGSEVAGIGIFTTDEEQTKAIMEEDPAIKTGVLIYEIHKARSFPGSCLPK